MKSMNHRERLFAIINGLPYDRPPVSFFNHNHAKERSPEVLVPRHVYEQKKFGWDFIKIMFRPTYQTEAWGCKCSWDPSKPSDFPKQVTSIVHSPKDLNELPVLPGDHGPFSEQISVVSALREKVGSDVPIIPTLFLPLTVLNRLAGAVVNTEDVKPARTFMSKHPAAMKNALDTITVTLVDYVKKLVNAGADGVGKTEALIEISLFCHGKFILYSCGPCLRWQKYKPIQAVAIIGFWRQQIKKF